MVKTLKGKLCDCEEKLSKNKLQISQYKEERGILLEEISKLKGIISDKSDNVQELQSELVMIFKILSCYFLNS